MTTAAVLAQRCDTRFKGNANSVVAASEWLNYLNDAYNRVNMASPLWPWLEIQEVTLVVPDSGTVGAINNRSAALPTDTVGLDYAYDVTDDYRLIDQMGRGDFFHQDHLRSEVGQPVTYHVIGSRIELNPTPSVATTVAIGAITMPTALAPDVVNVLSVVGGVAGDITVTGVALGDTLLSVMAIKDADQTSVNRTAEFAITATNTINNAGGSNDTGYHLVVTWRTTNSSNSPVFPSAYHDILITDSLASAYLDDGNPGQSDKYAARFESKLAMMKASLLMNRTETNQPIRDTFWS